MGIKEAKKAEIIRKINNKGYTLLEEYKTYRERINVKTSEGYLAYTNPEIMLTKSPELFSVHNPYTIHNIQVFLESNNKPYKVVSKQYKNAHDKLTLLCLEHGEFKINWASISQGVGCKDCAVKQRSAKASHGLDRFIEVSKEKGYTYIEGEYETVKSILTVKDDYGYLYEVTIRTMLRDCVPLPVVDTNKYSIDNIRLTLKKNYPTFELLSIEYKGSTEPLEVLCPEHGVYTTTWIRINDKCGCPQCSISNPESKCQIFLRNNNIKYEFQKKFQDCKNKRMLPFDYYIPDMNICIEIDGRQHFQVVEKFGGMEDLKRNLKHGGIKNKYCRDNNILLLRIPYTKFNIMEEILTDVLINKNLDSEYIIQNINLEQYLFDAFSKSNNTMATIKL